MELQAPPAALDPAARREGFLVGAVVGAALCAGAGSMAPAPSGRRRAATALADGLLVELTGGGVDLRRLAGRWVEWRLSDGYDCEPLVDEALDHLRQYDAPVHALPRGNPAALAAALPAALASASPRAMIAGSFHVARMLDPAESTALAATAIVLAAAAFLEGRRDFVPDVVAALRANGADGELVDAIRTIPRDARAEPARPSGREADPVAAAAWLLWVVHHRSRGADLLREAALVGGMSPVIGAVLGALLGARDGIARWPVDWVDGAGEEAVLRGALASRLGEAS